MGNQYDDLFESPKVSPGVEPPKTQHGCFFYGCLAAIVLALLMALVVGIAGYYGYRTYLRFVEAYTSPNPLVMPKVEMAPEERKALVDRVDAFQKGLEKGEDVEPLVLTGDELNAVLAEKSEVKDRVYFVIEGNTLKGQVSLPLDQMRLKALRGRYFNGKAAFHASLRDGVLVVTVESGEVNGKPLPKEFIDGLRNKNLAEDATKDPKHAELLAKLENIEIKDGKIIITARPKEERAPKRVESAKEKEKEEAPPGDQPKTESEPPTPESDKARDAPAPKEPAKDAPAPAEATRPEQ
jgi:hypothetical protein